MQQILTDKLRAFIAFNNPDLLLNLQETQSVTAYLKEKVESVMPLAERWLEQGKPLYITEELCVNVMTEELRPSRYLYLKTIMEEEFPKDYERLRINGILLFEMVNLLEACKNIFEAYHYSEELEDDRLLRYALIGQVSEWLA